MTRRLPLALAALLGAWLLAGVASVGVDEQAVVTRFGRVVAVRGPGLHWSPAWPVGRADRVPVAAVRTARVGGGEAEPLPTADQNLVRLALSIDYSADPSPEGVLAFWSARERAEGLLARAAEGLAAEWLASRAVDEALLRGPSELPAFVASRLPGRLTPYRLGVRVGQVAVAELAPPEEVRPAFEAVNRAQTAVQTLEFRARREAADRLSKAAGERYRQAQLGAASADERLASARADAASFLARLDAYRARRAADPLAIRAIWWDELGRALTALRRRGRAEPLDARVGADGLDVSQFLTR